MRHPLWQSLLSLTRGFPDICARWKWFASDWKAIFTRPWKNFRCVVWVSSFSDVKKEADNSCRPNSLLSPHLRGSLRKWSPQPSRLGACVGIYATSPSLHPVNGFSHLEEHYSGVWLWFQRERKGVGRRIKRKQFPFIFFFSNVLENKARLMFSRNLLLQREGQRLGWWVRRLWWLAKAWTILNVNYMEHPVGTEPKSRKAYNIIGHIFLISCILLCIDH